MNESKTTFAFVGVATVMALAAFGSHFLNQPTNSADFELVGKPFFEEFTSAAQAQSLEVAAVDSDSARLRRFSVENQEGLWRIPSHYNYPAEAAARLATTASSVMGINRDSLAGRLAKEHERLGVLDPLADDIEDPEGVGKRITLKDSDGEVVVDYIVGKEAGDVVLSETEQPFGANANEKYYYVRRPDEQQTYKVKLDIDLSTKFSDWIDPDLLRVDSNEVTKILIDNYSLEEDRSNPLAPTKALFKAQGDKLEITRKSNTDAWELGDLKPDDEELQTTRINAMLNIFDQMKIAGVRPKYKYKNHLLLTADLKLNQQPEFEKDPQGFARAINRLQNELDQKGFNLAGSSAKMELVAQNGDLEIGTDKGVVYTMHVGKAFDGDETAIEIGSTEDSESDAKQTTEAGEGEGEAGDSGKDAVKDSTDEKQKVDAVPDDEKVDAQAVAKNRYLMVRVSFDESLINPRPVQPVAPVAPVEPVGYSPPTEQDPESENLDAEPTAGDDEAEKPPEEQEPERNPEFVKHDEAIKAFLNSKIDFELAKTRFETETEAFGEKVTAGKELVKELNERFGDWYYVISGDNLNTLQTERVDLVKKKEKPAVDPVVPQRPDISFPDLPIAPVDPKEEPKEEAKLDAEGDSAEVTTEKTKEETKGEAKEETHGEAKEETQEGTKKETNSVEPKTDNGDAAKQPGKTPQPATEKNDGNADGGNEEDSDAVEGNPDKSN